MRASDPQTEAGKWTLNATQDSLTMVGGFDVTEKYKIEELTANRLRVTLAGEGWPDSKSHVGTMTFTAQ